MVENEVLGIRSKFYRIKRNFGTRMMENESLGIRSKRCLSVTLHPEEYGSLGPGSEGRMDEE